MTKDEAEARAWGMFAEGDREGRGPIVEAVARLLVEVYEEGRTDGKQQFINVVADLVALVQEAADAYPLRLGAEAWDAIGDAAKRVNAAVWAEIFDEEISAQGVD